MMVVFTTRGTVMVDCCQATMAMAVYSRQKMHGMELESLSIKNEMIY